jgi:hypothetical protein
VRSGRLEWQRRRSRGGRRQWRRRRSEWRSTAEEEEEWGRVKGRSGRAWRWSEGMREKRRYWIRSCLWSVKSETLILQLYILRGTYVISYINGCGFGCGFE